MSTGNIIPKNRQEVSTVVKVDSAKYDRWKSIKDKMSRNGKMMLFDDYRTSLGGADAGWGRKVFKKTMFDIGLLEPCDIEVGRRGTFCPTEKALEKYGKFFFYDEENDIWGLNNLLIEEFDEVVLPAIVTHSIEVRKQFKEAKKRREQARRIEKKVSKKDIGLF